MYEDIEGILYDWHNSIKLYNQNKDIGFFKEFIKDKENRKILVVGAGTGRVAIPLSDKNYIYALDIDNQRLERLQEKENNNRNIKIINKDIEKYESEEKFDFIIFPYSTIQNIHTKAKQKRTLKRVRELLKGNGICIIDISNKFKEFQNCDYTNICEGECKALGKYIIENEKVRVCKNCVKLYKKFVDENKKVFFKKIETWDIIDETEFEKFITGVKLKVIDKKRGYDNTTSHRAIYIIGREE